MDHVRQVVHIQPACGHIGGHKHVQVAEAELLHHVVALRLTQLAVQRVCVVAVLDQSVGNLLRLLAGAAKDDAVDAGIIIGDALQGGVLVPGVHHVIDVPDVLVAFVAATDDDLARLLHVLATVFRFSKSSSRPGVATTTCTPFRSVLIWLSMLDPP